MCAFGYVGIQAYIVRVSMCGHVCMHACECHTRKDYVHTCTGKRNHNEYTPHLPCSFVAGLSATCSWLACDKLSTGAGGAHRLIAL